MIFKVNIERYVFFCQLIIADKKLFFIEPVDLKRVGVAAAPLLAPAFAVVVGSLFIRGYYKSAAVRENAHTHRFYACGNVYCA